MDMNAMAPMAFPAGMPFPMPGMPFPGFEADKERKKKDKKDRHELLKPEALGWDQMIDQVSGIKVERMLQLLCIMQIWVVEDIENNTNSPMLSLWNQLQQRLIACTALPEFDRGRAFWLMQQEIFATQPCIPLANHVASKITTLKQ